MLREIDLSKNPIKPFLQIAKPSKQIIGNIHEAYNVKVSFLLGRINKLTFDLPYEVERNHLLVSNPNIDKTKERYLVKFTWVSNVEWFIINSLSENMNDTDVKSVEAFSLAYELQDKQLRGYLAEAKNATTIINEVLSETIWSIGTVNTVFDSKYRTFDVSEKTVLDFLFELATTFGAIIQFDSVNRKINFKTEDEVKVSRGFRVSYGNLLKSLNKQVSADEMVTSLKAFGKDGLGINSVNPTGSSAIQSFSFFMYPFERDVNKNVIKSSDYMTDSLCHAILDYEALVESKKGEFDSLLSQKQTYQTTLTTKENEKSTLDTELVLIQDRLDIQRASQLLTIHDFIYNGTLTTKSATLDSAKKYAVMAKVSTTTNVTVKLDGVSKTIVANAWTVLGKLSTVTSTNVEISGTATNVDVKIYVVNITDTEHSTAGNESTIINTYNDNYKQSQINTKQAEIDTVKTDIANVDTQINNLRNTLAIENNFTPTQITERNQFIIERTWSDSNYIDTKELYNDAIKKFEDLKIPNEVININIINFFEVLEEQKKWDKLFLAEEILIYYEKFKVDVSSMVIGMDIDFENQDIGLEIASVKRLNSEKDKLINMLYKSYSSSTSVDMNKYKWEKSVEDVTEINQVINAEYDAVKKKINAGANNSVEISRRGLITKNPDFPDEIVIVQSGVIALSKSNGEVWETAITADGVIAERLIGKLIAGQNLIIENESGKYTLDANGFTIEGGSLSITNGLPETQISSTSTSKWNSAEGNAKTYADGKVDPFKPTWDKSDIINKDTNFTWSADGFVAIDPLDTNKRVKLTSGGLGISSDGGVNYKTTVTGEGVYAEKIGTHGGTDLLQMVGGVLVAYSSATPSGRTLLGVDDTVPSMFDGNLIDPKIRSYGKMYTQRIQFFVPAGTYAVGDYLEKTINIKDYTVVAITVVSIIQCQSVAKEFYAYERKDGRKNELLGTHNNDADLYSFVMRISPHYGVTFSVDSYIDVDFLIVGWR
jgi:hypothetical protein